MPQIKNYDVYNQRMNLSIVDKCWWIDEISEDIDTIIDYGCATGELFVYLKNNYPGRFRKFIGIDNNEKMLQIAQKNFPEGEYYDSLNYVKYNSKAILVLNSVIHEILTYDGLDILLDIFDYANDNNISYIAIREMFYPNPSMSIILMAEDFQMPKIFKERWEEFCGYRPYESRIKRLHEFILKYSYVENWERESKEKYLWHWDIFSYDALTNYEVVKEFSFSIPQQKDKIRKDLGLDWPLDTHKKMLFKRAK